MDRFFSSVWPVAAITFLTVALPARPAHAQSGSDEREATKQRIERLREQIESSEARLSETTAAERASEQKLERLDRRIAERSELVRLYEERLAEIRRAQDSLRRSLQQRRQRLTELKKEYKRRATHAYKYGRLHDLALVLAARSVNEMLVRVRYLRRFAQQRKEKLQAVQSASRRLETQRQTLAQQRDSTAALLRRAEAERENLSRLRQSRRAMIQELRSRQSSIEETISEQRDKKKQAEARLARLKQAARAAQRDAPTSASSPERRAAFERLTGSFEQNKGSLPWPAEGVVTEEYGLQTDPVHGTKTPNPGVMIGTEPQAQVQAVFEGKVTRIDKLPDLGTIAFVRHGKYLSLYGNLSLVYAGEGQEIEAGAPIGRAGTDGAPRGAGVFFGLFRGSTSYDPTTWLRSR